MFRGLCSSQAKKYSFLSGISYAKDRFCVSCSIISYKVVPVSLIVAVLIKGVSCILYPF